MSFLAPKIICQPHIAICLFLPSALVSIANQGVRLAVLLSCVCRAESRNIQKKWYFNQKLKGSLFGNVQIEAIES